MVGVGRFEGLPDVREGFLERRRGGDADRAGVRVQGWRVGRARRRSRRVARADDQDERDGCRDEQAPHSESRNQRLPPVDGTSTITWVALTTQTARSPTFR